MLCEVALFGELRLPQSNVEAFLSSAVRAVPLPGWPDDVSTAERPAEVVLEDLRGLPLTSPEWLDLTLEGSVLKVRALLSKDSFLAAAAELNGLCGAAAGVGGGGTLLTVGLDALNFGYSLRCAFGHATLRALSTSAIDELRRSPAVNAMLDQARSPLEALLGDGAGTPFVAVALS
jgi:hypothetical protein